ncbi:MAG: ABC transporter ATP-binding protein [Lachnospiraceae bacterium]|nr:ABC transporter ATP-binding protein [Lachnospiraceae bacterium]
MSLLEVENLRVSYGDYEVLKGISFSLEEGQWLMLIGPNGAGKSTIVGAISQGVGYTGSIRYQDRPIREYTAMELARNIGVLAQNHYVGYAFSVREVVNLGRYAYSGGLFRKQDADKEGKVEQALERTGLTQLADHSVLELSGGELQRVFLAQLFAQDPRLLVLDEPTNHLDIVYQQQVFDLVREWITLPGRAVISVVHDLSLARAYGSRALLLADGKSLSYGEIEEVFSEDNLKEAYSVDVCQWMRKMLRQWDNCH